jgi:uncharacterized membrane protein
MNANARRRAGGIATGGPSDYSHARIAMALRTAILWMHVLAGALWIGACAAFVLAALALGPAPGERRDFIERVAPRIGWFCAATAAVVLATGAVNFILAGLARGFRFSMAFDVILAAKIALFVAMAAALAVALRTTAVIRAVLARGRDDAAAGAIRRMMKSHGAIAILGALALVLGLWLAGT